MDFFNWNSTLAEFKIKVMDFKRAYDFLTNSQVVLSPELQIEKEKLLSRGSVIKTTIETVTKAIDKANGVLQSVKTSIGIDGLAVLPALTVMLPLAIVASSVTAISYWLTDFNRLRSNIYDDLIESGKTPQQATAALATLPVEQSSFSNGIVKSLLPILAIAGIGYYLLK